MTFNRKEWMKEWKKQNKEKLAEQQRVRYHKEPDKHKAINKKWLDTNKERRQEYRKKYREENKDKFKEYDRQKWLRERKRQDESASRPRPEFCEFNCGRGPVVWDHDPNTGKWRSWPCQYCNTSMGLAKHRPDILRKMADVIEEHQKQHG